MPSRSAGKCVRPLLLYGLEHNLQNSFSDKQLLHIQITKIQKQHNHLSQNGCKQLCHSRAELQRAEDGQANNLCRKIIQNIQVNRYLIQLYIKFCTPLQQLDEVAQWKKTSKKSIGMQVRFPVSVVVLLLFLKKQHTTNLTLNITTITYFLYLLIKTIIVNKTTNLIS